jgi:hypothetical protein
MQRAPAVKVLTVQQPWASLLICKRKTIETRTWSRPFRGLLGIHAGKTIDPYGPLYRVADPKLLPLGALLGTVEVVEIRPMTTADEEAAMCDWREGLFAWVVTNATMFDKPIPMLGKLGLWDYKP